MLASPNRRVGSYCAEADQASYAFGADQLRPDMSAVSLVLGVELAQSLELSALVYQRLNDPDKAIESYERALRFNPSAIQWRIALAQLLVQQARYEQAARELRTVLVFDPENVTAKSLRDRIQKLEKK